MRFDNESLSTHEMNGAPTTHWARISGAVSAEMAGARSASSAASRLDTCCVGLTCARPSCWSTRVIVDLGAMFDMNYAATYLGLIDALAADESCRLDTAGGNEDRDAVVQQWW